MFHSWPRDFVAMAGVIALHSACSERIPKLRSHLTYSDVGRLQSMMESLHLFVRGSVSYWSSWVLVAPCFRSVPSALWLTRRDDIACTVWILSSGLARRLPYSKADVLVWSVRCKFLHQCPDRFNASIMFLLQVRVFSVWKRFGFRCCSVSFSINVRSQAESSSWRKTLRFVKMYSGLKVSGAISHLAPSISNPVVLHISGASTIYPARLEPSTGQNWWKQDIK